MPARRLNLAFLYSRDDTRTRFNFVESYEESGVRRQVGMVKEMCCGELGVVGHCIRKGQMETVMMNQGTTFTSPKIAREMARVFGSEAKTFTVEIKHRRVVGDFVRKIEAAHKQAEKSKLVFRV